MTAEATARVWRGLDRLPPAERVKEAARRMDGHLAAIAALASVRGRAVVEMRAAGMRWQEIADVLDMSVSGAMKIGRRR